MSQSLTMAEVLGVVAPAFGLTPHEVRGRRQSIVVTAARTAFCAMCAEFTLRSDAEIARFLCRDKDTVAEAQKRHPRKLKFDASYKAKNWDVQLRLGKMRDKLQPVEDCALVAARRFVDAGAVLSPVELRALCDRLIHIERAFQELALYQMESSNG